ncbi:MAG: hypothetical protein OXC81_03200 [Betaproteobacteria bacterium]|nr:hypothetical protein [Betaproteobacteria bacterium]
MARLVSEREYIDFLALFANNLIESGAFRDAASVYRLLARREPQQNRWLLGYCHCLLCAQDTPAAATALARVAAAHAAEPEALARLQRRLQLLQKRTGK